MESIDEELKKALNKRTIEIEDLDRHTLDYKKHKDLKHLEIE